jgi:uncharacterized protein (TIGR03067 family)
VNCLQVTFLTLFAAAPALKESDRPLLGEWLCTPRAVPGEVGELDSCYSWEFKAGGKIVLRLKDYEPAEWRYTTDPAKNPAHIDWSDGEDTVPGIYKVEGDTLTICYSHNPANDRPTRFESPKGTRLILLTFKRMNTMKR